MITRELKSIIHQIQQISFMLNIENQIQDINNIIVTWSMHSCFTGRSCLKIIINTSFLDEFTSFNIFSYLIFVVLNQWGWSNNGPGWPMEGADFKSIHTKAGT